VPWTYDTLNRRFGPWVSLVLGVLTLVVVRRGASYAPVAVGLVVVAWTLWIGLARLIDRGRDPAAPAGRLRRLAHAAGGSVVVALHQNVLFWLIPVWFGSATWPSANVAFPCALAAMALFSCFEYPYRALVLERPPVRTVWTSVVLFAALVPAGTLVPGWPLRAYIAASAALASGIAAAALLPRHRRRSALRIAGALAAVAAGTGAATLAAPLLPPVPIVCLSATAGTGIEAREVRGAADAFDASTQRVYAHFAVAAPARWHQAVTFEWSRDGEPVGRGVPGEVVGGRAAGFRTWSWQSSPGPGEWRADLEADGGQLVGRVRFVVR